MIKVSVIIPVYNVEKYLDECLHSVMNQTLKEIEIICVDDKSPDNCPRMLDEYAKKDSRIRVIHNKENRRQGFARNRGMDIARGKYLYFLDSDDMIVENALEELYALAERDSLDAVFFDCSVIYEDESLKKVFVPEIIERKGSYRDIVYDGQHLFEAFTWNSEWTCYPQRIFWNRDFIQREGIAYLEDVEHEDEYFAFAGILAAKRARYIRKNYFILRIRPNSVMTVPRKPRNYHGYLMNMYYMCKYYVERKLDSKAARFNIAKMHYMVDYLKELLQEKEDLTEWFKSDFDKTIYMFYNPPKFKGEELYDIDALSNYRRIYIYGAGQIGKRVYDQLHETEDLVIRAFLVSDMDGSPRSYKGVEIMQFDPASIGKDELVILAVGTKLFGELSESLGKTDVNWTYYKWIKKTEN